MLRKSDPDVKKWKIFFFFCWKLHRKFRCIIWAVFVRSYDFYEECSWPVLYEMFEITKKIPDGLIKYTGRPKGSKSLTALLWRATAPHQRRVKWFNLRRIAVNKLQVYELWVLEIRTSLKIFPKLENWRTRFHVLDFLRHLWP